MQRLLPQTVSFIVVLLYCSNAYLYFFNVGLTGFKPVYWYLLTIGAAMFVVGIRLPAILPATSKNISIWLAIYLCYGILSFFNSTQSDYAEQALIDVVEMTVLTFSFLVLFSEEESVRTVRQALVLVVLFSVAMNIIDFFTSTWTLIPGRAGGLFENPNIAGKVMVLSMLGSIPLLPNKIRVLYCFVVGLGVFLTFSRGPWIFWILGFIGLIVTGYIKLERKNTTPVLVAIGVILFALIFMIGNLTEYIRLLSITDYLTQDTMGRMGIGGTYLSDDSAYSRFYAAERSWAFFQNSPWFGSGLGYSREGAEVGPHNMFLMMAADGGVIGLSVFLSLLYVLFKHGNNLGKLLTVIYAFSSATSHNDLETPALLIIIALIVVTGLEDDSKEVSALPIEINHDEGNQSSV